MQTQTIQALGLSLGLGMLVGFQRQWTASAVGGIRTFPLVTLLGTLIGVIGPEFGWLAASGLVGVASLLVVANVAKQQNGDTDPGMTTEVAALVMYVVGLVLAAGEFAAAILVSGVVVMLLHWKNWLHGLIERMGEQDIRAVMNLVLIALVILPLLPDQAYGPYDVLNPYKIWLMVVLIVGISIAAYVVHKWLGARAGVVLGGMLGGLISSTATTVSYARQARSNPQLALAAAMVILIASSVVNVRVLFELGVVAPELLKSALPPIGIVLLVMVLECGVLYLFSRKATSTAPPPENPAQLKPAVFFGALYAVILFLVAATRDLFGQGAVYGIAAISGLTDVDAITLSTARLFREERMSASVVWRTVLIATMSNLVFKTGVAAALGGRKLFLWVAGMFAIVVAVSAALLWLWPDWELPLP